MPRKTMIEAIRDAMDVSMGRDERVAWGEYADLSADDLTRQLPDAVNSLAATLDRLPSHAWLRTVVYNYPERADRTVAWVAAHTLHEVVHHTMDVLRHDGVGAGS